MVNKNASFLHSLELDTITEMTNGKILFLGFTGTDQMKTILIYPVLELSSEVTSLKTELRSVGTDTKEATGTTSELTIKNTFFHSLGNDDKNAPFLHSLEMDIITEMTNGKLLFLL
jgi:hypothetical protein